MHTSCIVRVTLDNIDVAVPNGDAGAAIMEAGRQASARGRVVVAIHADGRALSESELARLPSCEHLALTSADPRELVAGALRDAGEALSDAQKQQAAAAEALQQGRTAEAMDSLNVVLSTWSAVQDVVRRGSTLLGIPPETLANDETDFLRATENLARDLRALKGTLEAQDWSGAADVLSYDLDGHVGVWRGLLVAATTRVYRMDAGAGGGAGGDTP